MEAWLEDLLSASSPEAWERLFQEHQLDLQALAKLKAYSADFYYDQPAQAERIARAAYALGKCLPPPGPALGSWVLANALLFTDHYREASDLFEQARAQYLALAMPLQAARLGVGQIWVLTHLGDWERALALAHEIEPLLAASADSSDRRRLGGVYNNLGILYDILGKYEEALAAYDRKLALLHSEGSVIDIARTQHNRGCALTYLNAFDEASLAFHEAETGFRDTGATADLARLAMNRALLFAVWERYTEAEAALLEADTLLNGLGGMEQQKNALLVYRALTRLRGKMKIGKELYTSLSNAQAVLSVRGPIFEEALAWLGLGYCAFEQDLWSEARAAFDQVQRLSEAGAGQPLNYLAQEGLARLSQSQGLIEESIKYYEAAIEQVECLRHDLQVATFRAGFLTDKLSLYQSLASLYLHLEEPEAAFATVERAKSRLLIEQLADRLHDDLTALQKSPDPEVEILIEVLQTLESQYRAIRRDHLSARGDSWLPVVAPEVMSEVLCLEAQARQLTHQLQRREPRLSNWASGYVASLSEVQTSLGPDELFIQYAVIHDEVWGFVVDSQGMRAHRVLGSVTEVEKVRRQWTAAVERILALVERYDSQTLKTYFPSLLADAEARLSKLYHLLVLPLVDTLDGAANLLISPDANLHYIPFHALLDMSSSPSYLLERFTISYVPSATLLSLNAQRESNHEELLLVGYGGDHLLQINEEMAVLSGIFPSAKQLTGERATAERVVETAPNCRLLHLASHARFRPDNVQLSSFALADRQLTLAEISRLRLGAELVTLSGCETGRGRVYGADLVGLASGFLGAGARSLLVSLWRVDDKITALLMSSFYHALCKGSGRAAALREAQLELLSLGRSEPTEYGLYRHPAYWAPFILLGAWDALELNNEEGEIVNA